MTRKFWGGLGVLVASVAAAYAFFVEMSHARSPGPGLSSEARVVSISPSTTEAIFAIGAGSLAVGRSRYCDSPPEALKLPQVGGYVDPNFEAILALRPTLVVGARGPAGSALTDKLTAQGIQTYFPEVESIAAIKSMILGLGEFTDHIAGAKDAAHRLDIDVEAVEANVRGLAKVRVLLVFGLDPIAVAGPGGFPDELLRRAGGVNVVTEGPHYPTLGIERVLALDPDLVLNAAMAEAHGAERIAPDAPGWRDLRAVKTGHVVALTSEEVLRPGPNIAEGLAEMARAIHPDAAFEQMNSGVTDAADASSVVGAADAR